MTYVGFDETVQYLRDVLDKDEKGFDVSFWEEDVDLNGTAWTERMKES